MDLSILIFMGIGFVAQMFDGAIGMGFGLISYTVLTGMGYPKAVVSASVNGAKIFTGAVAGFAHIREKNIDWAILRFLAIGGVLGAVIGCLMLVNLPHEWLTPVINSYLVIVGALILWRSGHPMPHVATPKSTVGVGVAGGVLESLSGVWGPLVTSNMVAMGSPPRFVIGSVTVAEAIVSTAVFTMLIGHVGFANLSQAVLGLLAGAIIAAPFAARLTRQIPKRILMIAVGLLVIATSGFRLIRFFIGS
jgi:uncharacterized protein